MQSDLHESSRGPNACQGNTEKLHARVLETISSVLIDSPCQGTGCDGSIERCSAEVLHRLHAVNGRIPVWKLELACKVSSFPINEGNVSVEVDLVL
jgi:hypothetical protein